MKIAPLSSAQSRKVLTGVLLGLFLGAMEATVVATALPTIVGELHGLAFYSWPMAVYILTAGVTGPLFGKISDLYGRKNLYLICLSVFLAGSILSGFSRSMIQLIVFRALQGIGAGGVLPLSIIVAGEMFPLEKRAKVQPLFSAMWGIAGLIGPPLGMLLTEYSWRLVFFVNIPFGLVSGWLIFKNLLEIEDPEKLARKASSGSSIDYAGAFYLMLGLLGFEIALPEQGGFHLTMWRLSLLGFALILLVLFVVHERQSSEPILPFPLFQYRLFSSAVLCQFFSGFAFFGSLAFFPLYVEAVMGKGIEGAGIVLTILLFFWVLFSGMASRLILKIGYRPIVISGTTLVVSGFLLLFFMDKISGTWPLYVGVVILGSGMGWVTSPLMIAVQTSVPKTNLGSATSALTLFRMIGSSVGVSLMGSVMFIQIEEGLKGKAKLFSLFRNPEKLLDPALRLQIPASALQSAGKTMALALHDVFMIALIGSFFSFFAGFLVPGGKAEKHVYQEPSVSGNAV